MYLVDWALCLGKFSTVLAQVVARRRQESQAAPQVYCNTVREPSLLGCTQETQL